MTDPTQDINHAPTPEFRAALDREIARAFRGEMQFGAPSRANRARRMRTIAGIGLGTAAALFIGFVLGTSTGLASANALEAAGRVRQGSPLTMLASRPVGNAIRALTCNEVAVAPVLAPLQQGIPVLDLPPASARTPEALGAVLGVRQLPGGKLLVNDGKARQVRLLDSALTTTSVVIDSTAGGANTYGPYGTALIPYRGDSSLFFHYDSQTLLALDAKGQVARTSALPEPNARYSFTGAKSHATGVDDKGRLIYKNSPPTMMQAWIDQVTGLPRKQVTQSGDSLDIFRADLDTRRVDTVGRVNVGNPDRLSVVVTADGRGSNYKRTINPLVAVDEWAVLSDGTIAFVRGHDYHIDWIHPDGTKSSSPKLPFDWKRLTDDDKQKLIDSARTADLVTRVAQLVNSVKNRQAETPSPDAVDPSAGGGGRGGQRGAGGGAFTDGRGGGRGAIAVDYVPVQEVADYYPPIRTGAAMPDLDGNLWILPTTSAQSKNGELVYDVVNPKKGLFERVRVPPGRSIAGFGKGGVVYLISGDRTSGFYLERTRLGAAGAKTPMK